MSLLMLKRRLANEGHFEEHFSLPDQQSIQLFWKSINRTSWLMLALASSLISPVSGAADLIHSYEKLTSSCQKKARTRPGRRCLMS
jgi:hypothetical protein